MEKHTSFKEELRKSLVSHALFPCVISIFLLIVSVAIIGFNLIERRSINSGSEFSEGLEALLDSYSEKAEELSFGISLKNFREVTDYKVAVISDIYQFLNRQEIRADFWLFDPSFNLVYSTNSDDSEMNYLYNYLIGQGESSSLWKKPVFMYDNWQLGSSAEPSCIIFKRISHNGENEGYLGFSISSDKIGSEAARDLILIVTNSFDRVFSQGAGGFTDERGKLLSEVRRDRGFFHMGGRSYYSVPFELYGGDIRIFAVADCTTYIFLLVIFAATAIFIALFMCWSIYMSAGRIASKKTDIMYELIDALSEVEKGNLDTKLDIRSGDEFELMGNSFNVMLGSIRHLIKRHQYLARENTLAAVQMLESQFNPHFLFNTLESVRYMIRPEPKAAEKMIVSLSRLLRYSIRRDDNMSTLSEESEFAEKYLDIMMYRFGDKLRYSIDIDEEFSDCEVPPMILQPVIENSIKYGAFDDRPLTIKISAYKKEGSLNIVISDDGKGIDEELLSKLKENMTHRHNHSSHIGLYNVHKRISLLYDGDCGAYVESRKDHGTTVSLKLPMNKREEA